jgi:hypothetical protein
VSTPQELSDTLSGLVSAASATCTFALGPPPTNDGRTSLDRINLFVDGAELKRDTNHAAGWDYADASMAAIKLYGSLCTDVMNGVHHAFTVTFICIDV